MNVIIGLVDYGYSLLCFQAAVLDNRLLLTICSPLYLLIGLTLMWTDFRGSGQVPIIDNLNVFNIHMDSVREKLALHLMPLVEDIFVPRMQHEIEKLERHVAGQKAMLNKLGQNYSYYWQMSDADLQTGCKSLV